MYVHLIMHGVHAKLLSIVHQNAAGFVFFQREDRISFVFGPMDKVV
jgi:hypothetical protein